MLMVQHRAVLVAYRMAAGLLGFSAIVTEIATLVARGTFAPVNFFSYFTIESNSIVVVVLLAGAAMAAQGKRYAAFEYLRGAATLYILVVGIGFAVLLSGLKGTEPTAVPWDNIVLHYLTPAAMLVDWLVAPPRRLAFRRTVWWLAFPLAYLAYTLTRGAVAGWYPYPFLNPMRNGYGALVLPIAGLMVLSLLLAWALPKVANLTKPASA